MESVLKLRRMRNFTLDGKIIAFKGLVLSKRIFHFHMSKVPNKVVRELQNIQKLFLPKTANSKRKHETLCKHFTVGGLKNVDIYQKVMSSMFMNKKLKW